MKADRSPQDNSLAFPLSLSGETTGPEVEGPTRFARALKRARFARGWTQARLAAQLAIPKRSIVSWETGERIPSVGMVVLLLDALFPGEELSLHQELTAAYIVDDLEHHGHVAMPFGGPGHGAAVGAAWTEQARAEHVTVTVLEVFAFDAPRLRHDVNLRRHSIEGLRSEQEGKTPCRRAEPRRVSSAA